MSAETNVGQYVKPQEAKDALDKPDNVEHEEIMTIVKEANHDIEVKLRPVANALPLVDGTPEFKAASRAGLLYVKARWKEKKHNFELAEKLDKRYEGKMRDLIDFLQSIPTDRTKAVIVSTDPRDAKLPLPTQYDHFVFDDFA